MELSKKQTDNIWIITIKGRLNAASAPEAEDYIFKIISAENKYLILNLANLEYISSGGLRIFLKAVKEINALGGNIVLCNPHSCVENIIDMAGLNEFLTIKATEEESIAAIL